MNSNQQTAELHPFHQKCCCDYNVHNVTNIFQRFKLDGQDSARCVFRPCGSRRLRHWDSVTAATCKQDRDVARVMLVLQSLDRCAISPAWLSHRWPSSRFVIRRPRAARRGTLGASSSPFDPVLICRSYGPSDGTDSYLGPAETSHSE